LAGFTTKYFCLIFAEHHARFAYFAVFYYIVVCHVFREIINECQRTDFVVFSTN